jgi:hypothetical protein
MAEQTRDIRYINRNFDDFRSALVEYAKSYFPDTYNDFNEASPGMMFMEMASYVGDVLAFYQDNQLQETFLQHAKNPENLYSLAYMMGYRPKITNASEVVLKVSQRVQANALASGSEPNWNQAVKISENSVISSTENGTKFLLANPVDFRFSSSYDPTEIKIYSLDEGAPAEFELTKTVKAFSGEIQSTTFDVGSTERFPTFNLSEDSLIKILDITDSDGNEYTEVPYLGQETVFDKVQNTDIDNNVVPNILRLKKVPRRFVTRFTSQGVLQIQFGAGVLGSDESTFLPNPNLLNNSEPNSIGNFDKAYDPSNFLYSRSYGLAPQNTRLTVRYVTGGGVASNVSSNTVTVKSGVTPTSEDVTYQETLSFTNELPARGGKDGDTVEELRQNSMRSYGEQLRVVTLDDYTVRALSLPSQFGSVAKVFASKNFNETRAESRLEVNPLALSMFVLAYDVDGKLVTATNRLKENLKTYLSQYMMVTDGVDIRDAFVINIGIEYEIITLPNYSARDVLLACTNKLKDYFNINRWSINDVINLAELYTLLDRIKGVQTVKNIKITNKAGGEYSAFAYDTESATKDQIVYPSLDSSCFEVKFPDTDIKGRVTTI